MGTRIIQPPPGDDCIFCWDADETPKFLYVMFDGVKLGWPFGSKQVPNGHLFKCEQDDERPCQWWYHELGPGWMVDVKRTPANGWWHISLNYIGVGSHFTGFIRECPAEHSIFNNTYLNPAIFRGYDGVATVIWMEAALELVEAMNMPNTQTFLELFTKDELFPVYKFCNTRYGMNQKFLIEP